MAESPDDEVIILLPPGSLGGPILAVGRDHANPEGRPVEDQAKAARFRRAEAEAWVAARSFRRSPMIVPADGPGVGPLPGTAARGPGWPRTRLRGRSR